MSGIKQSYWILIHWKSLGNDSLVLRRKHFCDPIMIKFIVQRTFTVSVVDIKCTQSDVSFLTHCIFRNEWPMIMNKSIFTRAIPAILLVVIVKITILISRSRVVKLSPQSLIQNFFIYSHKFGHALGMIGLL